MCPLYSRCTDDPRVHEDGAQSSLLSRRAGGGAAASRNRGKTADLVGLTRRRARLTSGEQDERRVYSIYLRQTPQVRRLRLAVRAYRYVWGAISKTKGQVIHRISLPVDNLMARQLLFMCTPPNEGVRYVNEALACHTFVSPNVSSRLKCCGWWRAGDIWVSIALTASAAGPIWNQENGQDRVRASIPKLQKQ